MITSPITQDVRNISQRGLKMAAMSLLELEALIEEHHHNLTFSSQIITDAARQILAVKLVMGER